MANSLLAPRDGLALLDPIAEQGPSRADASTIAAFHRVGSGLLRVATSETASAAVAVFRLATEAAPAQSSLRNSLGAALLHLARFASHAAGLDLLTEAERAFRAASTLAAKQRAPHATRLRYAVNLATTQWMRGERGAEAGLVRRSLTALRSIARELPAASPLLPHVQDNLGNALMALGRLSEAIESYEAGLAGKPVDPERARLLNNLGTAYAARGDFARAVRCHRDALALLPRNATPIARSLAEHNLGSALLQQALASEQPEREGKTLRASVKALQTAVDARVREQMPLDWAVSSVNLAAGLVGLGAHLCTAGDTTGLVHLRRAIALYRDALPELSAGDAKATRSSALVALEILGRLSPTPETQAEIRQCRIELLASATTTPDWPDETYGQAHKERGEDIVQFLTRVWMVLIAAGAVDLRTLRARDPSAAKAIDNYQQRRDPVTGERRRLPPELAIPTRREVTDRLAAAIPSAGDRPARLDWALRSRARRKRIKEKT